MDGALCPCQYCRVGDAGIENIFSCSQRACSLRRGRLLSCGWLDRQKIAEDVTGVNTHHSARQVPWSRTSAQRGWRGVYTGVADCRSENGVCVCKGL